MKDTLTTALLLTLPKVTKVLWYIVMHPGWIRICAFATL